MRKISSSHSNTLHVVGLEETERELTEEPRGESMSNNLRERERDLIQSEESEEDETLNFISIQSIFDETNLMCCESSLLSAEEPSSYSLAEKQEVWRDAMKKEILAILRNKTWIVVKPRRDPIGVKWVFQVKKDNMGKVVRHKARLVMEGYAQKQGIDYDEVLSPVVRMESIRILFSIVAQENWELHHLDDKTAFLNGEIK